MSKLSADQVVRLRKQFARREATARLLSLCYGISVSTVHDVAAGRSWSRTGGPLTRRKLNRTTN